jgi:hypothetical protein
MGYSPSYLLFVIRLVSLCAGFRSWTLRVTIVGTTYKFRNGRLAPCAPFSRIVKILYFLPA